MRPDRLGGALPRHLRAALANTLTALRAGITVIDASAGGIGSCPFARSADLDRFVATSAWMASRLVRPQSSRVFRRCAHPRRHRSYTELLMSR